MAQLDSTEPFQEKKSDIGKFSSIDVLPRGIGKPLTPEEMKH